MSKETVEEQLDEFHENLLDISYLIFKYSGLIWLYKKKFRLTLKDWIEERILKDK
jgi:hypothetical protein